jgi:hypothetical protein
VQADLQNQITTAHFCSAFLHKRNQNEGASFRGIEHKIAGSVEKISFAYLI